MSPSTAARAPAVDRVVHGAAKARVRKGASGSVEPQKTEPELGRAYEQRRAGLVRPPEAGVQRASDGECRLTEHVGRVVGVTALDSVDSAARCRHSRAYSILSRRCGRDPGSSGSAREPAVRPPTRASGSRGPQTGSASARLLSGPAYRSERLQRRASRAVRGNHRKGRRAGCSARPPDRDSRDVPRFPGVERARADDVAHGAVPGRLGPEPRGERALDRVPERLCSDRFVRRRREPETRADAERVVRPPSDTAGIAAATSGSRVARGAAAYGEELRVRRIDRAAPRKGVPGTHEQGRCRPASSRPG